MVEFTQFLFPHGQKKKITIELHKDIEDKYRDLEDKGFKFEIENNRGVIWATCIRETDDDQENCDVFGLNDENVPKLIGDLISKSWEKFIWKEI